MASTCPHTTSASLHPPRPSDSVYREDCTLCFDSIDDPHGLQVCLSCFNGGCASPDRAHGQLHASQAAHPLAVTIKRTRKLRKQSPRGDSEPPEKISKLAIQAETEEERYDVQTSIHCFECGVSDLEASGAVGETVAGILRANTFAKSEEVKAWEQEMTACEHTLCLEQTTPRTIPSGSLSHCADCSLQQNLWLCLTCGNLGCGRSQWGVPNAGNNHAINHTTSTAHPVAVKLGSLTADGGADIYCYACDEERVDPELVAHLKHWGVDIEGRVKTEKSMTEMNVEQNLTWEFRMTDEKGVELRPVNGAGLTGLRNLGNSCYLNSVLQAVFSMPEFADRYLRPGEDVSAAGKPAEDLEIQLRKLADGLLSGRYSKPAQLDADQATENDVTWQVGLAPAMLKHLIGRGHAEFSTMRQQDSFELLLHLLKMITRSQASAKEKYGDVKDPVDAMRFVMEQRLQCLGCGKVKYRRDEMDNLSVAVPIKRVAKPDTSGDATAADGDGKVDGEKEKEKVENFEPVTLKHCLDLFTAPETVELTCSSCKSEAGLGFSKQTLFKTFPTILAINARRFEVSGWVPTKRDVPVIVNDSGIDMETYRSQGKREGEVELPEDDGGVGGGVGGVGGGGGGFVVNEEALGLLMGMGFPRVRCAKALKATGNSVGDVEGAAGWLFEHMEDADIDEPMVEEGRAGGDIGGAGGGGSSGGGMVSEESIENLGNMGFAAPQARQALKATGGDMERAVDWLFSHPDAIGDFGDDAKPASTSETVPPATTEMVDVDVEDKLPAKFGLRAIVCHKGSSIHAGHYVAFVRKGLGGEGGGGDGGKEGWVLFNDEKVALGSDAEEMRKFAYIYFFRREGA
ncbi:ubiquitin C-terminal hydrolase Ubp14 [Elasticomyces elasticus]|nr:ubiquitin C-terminal hydrolase Ubp14 [Elasticomyces elasticus]KAK3668007.1 ubiquitin C-terminal hydrolase Ubp14 [Elasticomyces elasticus]KAK4925052.1 ubiquitin C-terminal hydrolase Ubp14 [Elasticomyces elasticus]KAK5767647.1 ubiquitin C-terminal hydrolase Ubp14 [Elasticomyces elasticus]